MKDALQAIRDRSSIRAYSEEPLTKEELDVIIQAGLQAPTAANRQEIYFTVVDGKNPILSEIQQEMLKGRPDANPPHNFYYEAPVVIILSGKEDFSWSTLDAGIAVENMAIAAEATGLGNLIIGCIRDAMRGEKKEYFRETLKIPEGYEFEVAFALGKKATEKVPHEYSEEKQVTYLC